MNAHWNEQPYFAALDWASDQANIEAQQVTVQKGLLLAEPRLVPARVLVFVSGHGVAHRCDIARQRQRRVLERRRAFAASLETLLEAMQPLASFLKMAF